MSAFLPAPPPALAARGQHAVVPAAVRFRVASLTPLAGAALALLACLALALLVRRFDALLVLGVLVAAMAAMGLLLRPGAATLIFAFLLYTNIPVIAYKQHGVPQPIAGAFLLLLFIPLAHHLVVRREGARADRVFALMLLYLGVLLLASLRARDLGIAWDRTQTFILEGLLLYWLLINVVRGTAAVRRVLWVLLAAGALLGGLSVYQEVTGDYRRQFGGLAHRNHEFMALERQIAADPDDAVLRERKDAMKDDRSARAEGPMDEPNAYGQIMLVLLPLALYHYRTAPGRMSRAAAAALGGLIGAGMLASQSRGAILGLAVLVAIALSIRWLRPRHLLAGALALACVLPLLGSEKLIQRITSITTAVELFGGGQSGEADYAIRGRATEMLAALQAFADHPVLGVGPGQYSPFYSIEYQQRNPRLKFKDLMVTRRAHSLYLETAAELGLVGLAALLSIIALLMRGLWHARREWSARGGPHAHLATALWLSLLAYLVTSVFLHLMYERYLWLLVGIAGSTLLALSDEAREAAVPGADRGTRDGEARATPAGVLRSAPDRADGLPHPKGI